MILPGFPGGASGVGTPAPSVVEPKADARPGVPPCVKVREHLDEWRELGASEWVLDTLANGIFLQWARRPPKYRSKGYRVAERDRAWLEQELQRGLAGGFYRELSKAEADAARCVVPAFVVWSAGKPRMVIDYRIPNACLVDKKFKYESLFDLAPQLRPGDAMISWDIKDAFFHLEVRPRDRKYLCFTVLGRVFEPVAMPFGLRHAPFFWTKVCRPVVAALRKMGFRLIAYVDDFGGAPPSPPGKPASVPDALAGGEAVRTLLSRLGLGLHPRKGVWTGPTCLPLLGHLVDTERGMFILQPGRADKVMRAARSLLARAGKHRRWVPAKTLRNFCGLGVSTTLSVTTARLHLRALYNALGGTMAGDVQLSHQGMRDLAWWANLASNAGLGRALWPGEPSHTLHTDASLTWWGAVLDGVLPARGFHAPERKGAHINVLELVTVRLALESFLRFLTQRDTWLLLKSDSTVTVGAVNALSSRSPAIMRELRLLHERCLAQGLTIRAEHLPSAFNAYADRLSREGDSTD